MATFDNDTFTGTAGTLLTAHTPETGGSWVGALNNAVLTTAGRARSSGSFEADVICQGTPAGADYDVQGDVFVASATAAFAGVCGRSDASAGINAGGFNYEFYYDASGATKQYIIVCGIANNWTTVGTSAATLTAGTTVTLKLQMRGTSIIGFVNGTAVITGTNTQNGNVGKAGIVVSASGTVSDSLNYHIDNFSAVDAGAASAFIPSSRRQLDYAGYRM